MVASVPDVDDEANSGGAGGASLDWTRANWRLSSLICIRYLRANGFLWPQNSRIWIDASIVTSSCVGSNVAAGDPPMPPICFIFQTAARVIIYDALIKKNLESVSSVQRVIIFYKWFIATYTGMIDLFGASGEPSSKVALLIKSEAYLILQLALVEVTQWHVLRWLGSARLRTINWLQRIPPIQ